MKIVWIIGHDAKEQGAYGNKGVSEFRFNDQLIIEMRHERMFPDKHEYRVMYRDPSISGYKSQMIDLHRRINAWGADVSIELHFNSFHRDEVNGNEVLYCSNGGKRIADILDECLDVLPNRDRGVKKVSGNDRGAGFCCRGQSYAIISEPFFGSHQHLFTRGGELRSLLKNAYKKFLEKL